MAVAARLHAFQNGAVCSRYHHLLAIDIPAEPRVGKNEMLLTDLLQQ